MDPTDPTRRIPAQPDPDDPHSASGAPHRGGADDTWSAPGTGDGEPPEQPTSGRRSTAMLVLGAVLGAIITVFVIALGTSSPEPEPAADAEIASLQAELDDRDAQLAERDAEIAELRARLEGEDADAAARAAELDERRDALDERATSLDERAAELDRREAELDAREAEIRRDEEGTDPVDDPDDDDLSEEVDTIVERVLEEIRQLFGRSD